VRLARGLRPETLAVVAFAALTLATVGAFVVTMRLKGSPPLVSRIFYPRFISPNGDGFQDTAVMRFRLRERSEVTVEVVDARGRGIRRLADGVRLARGGPYRFRWDGRVRGGRVARDGRYRMRVSLGVNRSLLAPLVLTVDTAPPRVRARPVRPRRVSLRHRVRPSVFMPYRVALQASPLLAVHRVGRSGTRVVERVRVRPGPGRATWDLTIDGRRAAAGVYALQLVVADRAGNRTRAPRLPSGRREARRAPNAVIVSRGRR
jgi:hypothetical protein